MVDIDYLCFILVKLKRVISEPVVDYSNAFLSISCETGYVLLFAAIKIWKSSAYD